MLSLAFILASATLPLAPPEQPIPIKVEELGKKYQLIGRLGKPLGELMTLTVTVEEDNEKDVRTHWVTVTNVNGTALKTPIPISIERAKTQIKDFTPGRQLRLRAYESGGMIGRHLDAWREANAVAGKEALYKKLIPGGGPPYNFYTWLVVVKEIETGK